MIYYQRHIKGVSFLVVILVLSQSCFVYKKSPSIEMHTNSEKNTLLKIYTNDGNKYKVRWIEERDGNIYSITNTIKVTIKKERLRIGRHNPELFDIENKGDYISGLEIISHDTSTVLIPIDQIQEIKHQSKGTSVAVDLSIILGTIGIIVLIAGLSLSGEPL